jgi:hypothetical protein
MFAAMLGGWEIILILGMLVALPLTVAAFAFWIWMLVHAIQNQALTDGEKIGWVLAIALTHFLGALLYFFIGKPKVNQATLPTG